MNLIIEYTYPVLVLIIAVGLPISAILNGKKIEQQLIEAPESKGKFYQQTLIFLAASAALIRHLLADVGFLT